MLSDLQIRILVALGIPLALSGTLLVTFILFLKKFSPKLRPASPSEREFITSSKKRVPAGNLQDPAKCALSVVVPAYNEASRLPLMLPDTLKYLRSREKSQPGFTFEIILVDDGSKDETTQVALEFAKKNKVDEMKVIQLEKNRGKGGAVTQGILAASGEWILFADADGASLFSDVENLESYCSRVQKNEQAVGVGSRAHLDVKSVVKVCPFNEYIQWANAISEIVYPHGSHARISFVDLFTWDKGNQGYPMRIQTIFKKGGTIHLS